MARLADFVNLQAILAQSATDPVSFSLAMSKHCEKKKPTEFHINHTSFAMALPVIFPVLRNHLIVSTNAV